MLADYRIHLNEAVRDLALLRMVKLEKGIQNVEGRDVKEDPDHATDDDGQSAGSAGSGEDSAGSGEGSCIKSEFGWSGCIRE